MAVSLHQAVVLLGKICRPLGYTKYLLTKALHPLWDMRPHHVSSIVFCPWMPFTPRPTSKHTYLVSHLFFSSSDDNPQVFWDESIYSMRDKSKDRMHQNASYYGFRGFQKQPNSYIVLGCCLIIIFGAAVHLLVIK